MAAKVKETRSQQQKHLRAKDGEERPQQAGCVAGWSWRLSHGHPIMNDCRRVAA
jgi:hypothetical protein